MQLRKAVVTDVPAVQALINNCADAGLMLPRSLGWLYENIRDFTVVLDGNRMVGTGALHVAWDNLAEIRSLAVEKRMRGRGIGRALVEALLAETMVLGLNKVFALTYQSVFFEKLGFRQVAKETLPHKVWTDCLNCVKFPNCDEVSVLWDDASRTSEGDSPQRR